MSLEDSPKVDKGRIEIWKDNIQPINLNNYFMLQERRPHSRETKSPIPSNSRFFKNPRDFMRDR